MLVLSRKLGEKVYIGKDIIVTVVDFDRGKIRLGITCPTEIKIYREEIHPCHLKKSEIASDTKASQNGLGSA
jgi:carbon storage regulator